MNGTYVKDLPLEAETSDAELEYGLKSCLEVNLSSRTRKKHPLNFIIYGAPGTGKTYSTAEYALAIIEDKSREEVQSEYSNRKELMDAYKKLVKEGQIVFTTFHQSYGYEEFIQGLRPDTNAENMTFKTVDGMGLSQILCKHRNAVQIEQNLFKAEVAQAAAALFSK